MKLVWNRHAQCWIIDIYDGEGNALILGLAAVTGLDLLEQYKYLSLGGQLIVQTDNAPDAVPTFQNLGTEGHIFYAQP